MVTAMIWCAAYCAYVGITLAASPVLVGDSLHRRKVRVKLWGFGIGVVVLAALSTIYVNGV